MSSSVWRRENLKNAFGEFCSRNEKQGAKSRGLSARFAEKAHLSPQLFSNLLHGQKNIGSALARKIEKNVSLPQASLDADPAGIIPAGAQEKRYLRACQDLFRASKAPQKKSLLAESEERLAKARR